MKSNKPNSNGKSLLNGTLYKDISIYKDTCIKIASNKDNQQDQSTRYDYEALRKILEIELGKSITIKQAEQIGKDLLDVYEALYFEDIQEYNK